jgi:hypothetical protein
VIWVIGNSLIWKLDTGRGTSSGASDALGDRAAQRGRCRPDEPPVENKR